MPVTTKSLPTQTAEDPPVYFNKLDETIRVHDEIAGNFAAHESISPNMTVTIDSGKSWDGTTFTSKAEQITTTIVAPAANPRIDRIAIVIATGTYVIITGAENVSPVAPAYSDTHFPVCQVSLVVSQTTITNEDIIDERALVSGGGGGAPYNITDNSDTNWLTVDINERAEFAGDVALLGDGQTLYLGGFNDLSLQHDGIDSEIVNRFTGDLYIRNSATGGDTIIQSGLSGGRVIINASSTTVGAFTDTNFMLGNNLFGGNAAEIWSAAAISAPSFMPYSIASAPTTAFTADIANGSVFELTLGGNTAITFANVPISGYQAKVKFILIQDAAGSRVPSFPASVKWAGGVAPTWGTAAGNEDVVEMFTYDGGVTWRANLVGQNYA